MATKKKTPTKKPQDAIALLKQDHEKVRTLLGSLEKATGARREKLLGQVEQELKIHTTIEEEIFYPAFKAAGGKEHAKLFHEAMEEHRAVEALVLPDLLKTETATEQFSGRAKVLKELVEHHADEEEEEMFPRARKTMDREELRDLGERMAARKKELM